MQKRLLCFPETGFFVAAFLRMTYTQVADVFRLAEVAEGDLDEA